MKVRELLIKMESDCLTVIASCRRPELVLGEFDLVLLGSFEYNFFSGCIQRYIDRDGNCVTHYLVRIFLTNSKRGFKYSEFYFKFSICPNKFSTYVSTGVSPSQPKRGFCFKLLKAKISLN